MSAAIRFADNGPGLPAGSESRMFDRFFRGRLNRRRPPRRRTGFGNLPGDRRAHGGEITAANRPEGGAEFRIVLPATSPRRS